MNVSAVYSSACVRETGIVVNVDSNTLQMLTLKGEIKTIPRFNIVYIANYPIGSVDIPNTESDEQTDLITVKTIYNDEIVDLLKGWMIDYSEEQISFLTVEGFQKVVDIADIWDIEIEQAEIPDRTQKTKVAEYNLVHPYPFMHCKADINASASNDSAFTVYPQLLLSDPLWIKRELDRLKDGYDKLRKYDTNKRFYPVPQVYDNEVSLGVWINYGSRYGASRNRKNSFIPAIVRESSDGPFSIQSKLVTGSSPMFYSVHEEPQSQAYYSMKASYVHFSIMVDFSLYTMGDGKYRWSEEDMDSVDNRENEFLHLTGGFDFGPVSFDIAVMNKMYYGIQYNSEFHDGQMDLNKGSLSYHNRFFRMELLHGTGFDTKPDPITVPDNASEWELAWIEAYNEYLASIPDFTAKFTFYRYNLDLFSFGKLEPQYSLIFKSIELDRGTREDGTGAFQYKGESITNALYLSYPLTAQLDLSGYVSVESIKRQFGESDLDKEETKTYSKGGVSLALLF